MESRRTYICSLIGSLLYSGVLYSQDDLALLSDEFDHPSSVLHWQRIHEVEGWNADQLERWEVDTSRVGHMTLMPYTSSWFEDYRGVLVFKEVTGDFVATTEVVPRNRSEDGAPGRAYSLAGIMARSPRPIVNGASDWTPGEENYVFLSLGTASNPGTFQFEVKTTLNSNSNLEISNGYPKAQLRMAKIGPAVIILLKPDGQDWLVHRRYSRPDMPATLQLGITVYTDWDNVSPLDPLVQNQTVITDGNPDLTAQFNFFRYSRPNVPASLEGLDLTNSAEVNDATLLSFLGFESVPNNPNPPVRINHEGRILDSLSDVNSATLFNTPESDAVVSSLQVFPRNHGWNEDVSAYSLLSNSMAMIAQVKADLPANRQTLRPFYEMNWVLIPEDQPLVPIDFLLYGDESDPGPWPIPNNTPVEGWPRQTGGLSLQEWQQDINGTGGDRHSIILQPSTGVLYESWQMRNVSNAWQASNGALFNINDGLERPQGWTSADAGGHSMFGGLVRYDECARGTVEHAIRLIVDSTRREYFYPANHFASSSTLETRPAMGERFRLRADFEIPESWSIYEKAVCRALKKYGAIVMDNGGFFSISVAPDDRFPEDAFDNLRTIDVDEFEVVQTTTVQTGSRATGALAVDAGNNRVVQSGTTVPLRGQLYDPDGSASVDWYLYEGPDTVTITDNDQLSASVQLAVEGNYTFMFRARDGVHSPAYDAVSISVSGGELQLPETILSLQRGENDARYFRYQREDPQFFDYQLETSTDLVNWFPNNVEPQVELVENDGARILVVDTSVMPESRLYYRLRVSTE